MREQFVRFGHQVNVKEDEGGEQPHIRRRRRNKLIAAARHPLMRRAANEVWTMDFVFARVANGRMPKCLTVVYDAAHRSDRGAGRALDGE